jgi:hypothetical protein
MAMTVQSRANDHLFNEFKIGEEDLIANIKSK